MDQPVLGHPQRGRRFLQRVFHYNLVRRPAKQGVDAWLVTDISSKRVPRPLYFICQLIMNKEGG